MACIGIDLGTTNCCIAARMDNGIVEVIPNRLGKRTTPSMIAFCDGEIYFGEHAKNKMTKSPENVIYGVKYLIGRKFNDFHVQRFCDKSNFRIFNIDGYIKVCVDEDDYYTPEELSGLLLKELKSCAEEYLDVPVETAVITVPTYFEESSRQATIDAGKIAGFKNVSLLNEPTAAAIAYGEKFTDERTILVFDFGGGTFDISVLKLNKSECTVLGIDGDLHMGGDDIDQNVFDYLAEELYTKYQLDVRIDRRSVARLRNLCEAAKIALSSEKVVDISDVFLDSPDKEIMLSRDKFNELNDELFTKCIDVMKACLEKLDLNGGDVDAVLLIGGSTRNCSLRERIEDYIGNVKKNINPDEAVAIGAAMMASNLAGDGFAELKVNQLSAHSLGIDTDPHDEFFCVIPQFSKIPAQMSSEFYTHMNSSCCVINIYAGESKIVNENKFMGTFEVRGISPGDDGKNWITITFFIDANGILRVTADDLQGASEGLSIKLDKGNLTNGEIERLSEKIQNKYVANN